jgi:hypothetical protein
MTLSRYTFRIGTRIGVALIVLALLLIANRLTARQAFAQISAPQTSPSQGNAPLGNSPSVMPSPTNPPTVPGAPLPGAAEHATPEQLLGKTVHDARDTRVGRIEAAQLDEQGNVKGVVVALGGVGGIGARPVTLGRDELQFGDDAHTVKTRLTKDELDRRPAPAK